MPPSSSTIAFFLARRAGPTFARCGLKCNCCAYLALAREGHCGDALTVARHLGSEVPGLAFTRDGLEPILQSARTSYLLGTVFASCGQTAEAKAKFELASTASASDQIKWAWLAAQEIARLQSGAMARPAASFAGAGGKSQQYQLIPELVGIHGSIVGQGHSGSPPGGNLDFGKRLLLPDRMLAYHLTRLASPKLRRDHFDLCLAQGLAELGGCPGVSD